MKWDELYEMQTELDEKILSNIPQNREDVISEKTLALVVEISELANETRCFKYWSKKGPNKREVILEEYVDGFHFILSLGLDFNFRFDPGQYSKKSFTDLTEAFHNVYETIYSFKNNPTSKGYQDMMATYLSLGYILDFSEQNIMKAYAEKNQVNHERQHSGY
ncbi:dUTPase [Halalkalibacillus sediminis]|uniref:dUTPase n=1 Tax=Halalkalibacillus sediminis TaxID=2018042 RepID=A0A2I0QY37_9BACI|nr:dUTP diphosphatase [Halalkalibacillus sediminis]PKR79243.1 dUTPase [Halalkalibacillus sediminis]